MSARDLEVIAGAARRHADHVSAQVRLAANREEHIRLTQLAFEADWLATTLESQLLAASA